MRGKKINKPKPLTVLLSLLILGMLVFIWGNSMKSIPESREQSLSLLETLTPFLDRVFGAGVITNHILRKTAHFCEFGLLGVLLALNKLSMGGHRRGAVLLSLGEVLFTASMDETIQLFYERGSQLRDVLLDFCGGTTGVLGIFLIALLIRRARLKKSGKMKKAG